MRPLLKRAALLVAFAASGLAAAIELGAGQIAVAERETVVAVNGISDDVTGSVVGARAHYLPLTDEQRSHIFDGVMKVGTAPVADVPSPIAAVPRSVPLQDLPASVTREIPMVEGYKFVKLDDRILLVSPLDRSIVAEMPRYKPMLD